MAKHFNADTLKTITNKILRKVSSRLSKKEKLGKLKYGSHVGGSFEKRYVSFLLKIEKEEYRIVLKTVRYYMGTSVIIRVHFLSGDIVFAYGIEEDTRKQQVISITDICLLEMQRRGDFSLEPLLGGLLSAKEKNKLDGLRQKESSEKGENNNVEEIISKDPKVTT